jgi:hypothetical protein
MNKKYKLSDFFPMENPWISFKDWIEIVSDRRINPTPMKLKLLESLVSKLSDIDEIESLELAKKDLWRQIYKDIDPYREYWRGDMSNRWTYGDENSVDVRDEFEKKSLDYYKLKNKRLMHSERCRCWAETLNNSLLMFFTTSIKILSKKLLLRFIRIIIKWFIYTLLLISYKYFDFSSLGWFPSSFEICLQNHLNLIDTTITENVTWIESLIKYDYSHNEMNKNWLW